MEHLDNGLVPANATWAGLNARLSSAQSISADEQRPAWFVTKDSGMRS